MPGSVALIMTITNQMSSAAVTFRLSEEEGSQEARDGIHVEELEPLFSLELDEAVAAMAVSPEDTTIAIGTIEDEIIVLNTDDGAILHKLEGHPGGVNSLAYLTNTLLASAGEDGTAATWDLESGKMVRRIEVKGVDADKTPDGHTVSNIAVSDKDTFAVSAGKSIHILSLEDTEVPNEKHKIFPPVGACVEDLKFLPSGELLCGYYGGVTIYSPEVGERGVELPFKGNMLSVSATEDKKWIIAGCHDATVHIWNLMDDGNLQELSCGGYEGKVTNCIFNSTYKWMASTGGNRNVVWDFSGAGPSGSTPTICLGHTGTLNSQAWQPGSASILLTGGRDGRVCVFDVEAANLTEYGGAHAKVCFPDKMGMKQGDEIICVAWGKQGRSYSGHISGLVQAWAPQD